jgi:hypothetical protein
MSRQKCKKFFNIALGSIYAYGIALLLIAALFRTPHMESYRGVFYAVFVAINIAAVSTLFLALKPYRNYYYVFIMCFRGLVRRTIMRTICVRVFFLYPILLAGGFGGLIWLFSSFMHDVFAVDSDYCLPLCVNGWIRYLEGVYLLCQVVILIIASYYFMAVWLLRTLRRKLGITVVITGITRELR